MPKEPGKGPVFGTPAEFADTYRQLRAGPPSARKAHPKLRDVLSLMDVFEALRQAADKADAERLLKTHKLLGDLAAGKQDGRGLAQLRTYPVLACLADETGSVEVGGRGYDVLTPDGAQQVLRMLPTSDPIDDSGAGSAASTPSYEFVTIPPEEWTTSLPCGPWTVLPGYPTHFFDARVGGRVVLVQLWKGTCPNYLGMGPGGVGAEVGLYNRDINLPTTYWWPDYQHKKIIEFTLFNPVTTAPFFSAPTTVPIWWAHKWMAVSSYDRYVRDQQNLVPAATEQYVLRCRIDGVPFEW